MKIQQYIVTIYSKHDGKQQLEQLLQEEVRAETISAYAIKHIDVIQYKIEQALLEYYNYALTEDGPTYSDIQGMAGAKAINLFDTK